MGTSSQNGGQRGGTPLIPTWLEPDNNPPEGTSGAEVGSTTAGETGSRFTSARTNFSQFVASGDRRKLGRSVAGYVARASGGPRTAALRMGASRAAAANLYGFLNDVRLRGESAALRALNLGALAGRPIEEVFIGLADYVCRGGGSIDDSIAREAFLETIVELADVGVTTLDTLTEEQMKTVFELFISHAIEARMCNDVGMKMTALPVDVESAELIQQQLRDFIRGSVSDALSAAEMPSEQLTPERSLDFVDRVYQAAFSVLEAHGEALARGDGRED